MPYSFNFSSRIEINGSFSMKLTILHFSLVSHSFSNVGKSTMFSLHSPTIFIARILCIDKFHSPIIYLQFLNFDLFTVFFNVWKWREIFFSSSIPGESCQREGTLSNCVNQYYRVVLFLY